MATLLLSQGVPMLLAGDEFLRSQRGNNNAWCQDNDVSWLDWELSKSNAEMLRFTRSLIAFRKRHPALPVAVFSMALRRAARLAISFGTASSRGSPISPARADVLH